jgi:cystathionine gamma-synthase
MQNVKKESDIHGLSTASVHAGESRFKENNSLTNPIYQTSTFVYRNMAEVVDYADRKLTGDPGRFEYSRYGNPTERVVIRKLAELEGAEDGVLFPSGMCAITTTLFAFLKAGDHLVVSEEAYRKTRDFCTQVLSRFGVETTWIPVDDQQAWVQALRPETKIVLCESPTNPHLHVVDLRKFVSTMRQHTKALLIIDATFATPINLRPLEFGIDLVIHSGTKYLGGHNDLLAGVVLGRGDWTQRIRELQGTLGGNIDPQGAYLLLRGLKTLAIRMKKHNENGQAVAEFLEAHPKIRRVYYPGLPSHPHHEIAKQQMSGFGGVVSFEIDGDREATFRFIDAMNIPYLGPSLGGVESLIYHPAALTFADLSPEERQRLGLTDNLVRLAVGIEDASDIIKDLERALAAV